MGLGPMTFRLRIECTTNCATPAKLFMTRVIIADITIKVKTF